MFVIKKVIGSLANPLTIALLVAGIAAVLHFRGNKRAVRYLLIAAALCAYLGSIRPVADALLAPLEQRYPPLQTAQVPPDVKHIVVLGSWYTPREGFPVTSALDEAGLVRIVEGVRLMHQLAVNELLVFGGAPGNRPRTARGYAQLARELGISDASIVIRDDPLDTGEEAEAVFDLIGDLPFVLVTSASHMPRAMRLMHTAGARPIPAPTGHRVLSSGFNGYWYFLPGARNLRKTESAMHEYLGLLALTIGVD